jgi:hypothetical protein
MTSPSSEGQAPEYTSVLTNWDSRSAVRSKPRRMFSDGDEGRLFFSVGLTPPASHPLIVARGANAVEQLLTRRLYSYLDFTTILEQEIVNPVLLRLSRDSFGLALPEDMRFDAHRIYCDEAYHALFSVDVKRQVERRTGIAAPVMVEPQFARVILDLKRSAPPDLRGLVELCAATVSETLISGTLTEVPRDESVVGFVREMFADHAADERTHHAYFARLIRVVWPQLDKRAQRALGPGFADLILAFLRPDRASCGHILRTMGIAAPEAGRIIEESYSEDRILAEVRHAARSTISLLREIGVLADGRAADHFGRCGLLA